MNFIPLGDRVYVRLDAVEEKKVRGIVLPDKHSEPVRVGTVLAVGPDVKMFQIGDRVLVSYMAGLSINAAIDGFMPEDDTHRVMCEGEIPMKVEG